MGRCPRDCLHMVDAAYAVDAHQEGNDHPVVEAGDALYAPPSEHEVNVEPTLSACIDGDSEGGGREGDGGDGAGGSYGG